MWWPFRRRAASSASARLGRMGERLAGKTLRHKRWRILARNYRCPSGEIDLIALDPSTRRDLGTETVVFVEVKTRAAGQLAPPESAVNAEKRRRLRRAARYYLTIHPAARGLAVRYDVITVVVSDSAPPEIRHIHLDNT